MLNELIQAAKAIPDPPDTLHKTLKTLPNYPAYKVLLGQGGTIAEVIPWHEDMSGLRKWQPGGNGFSTPVFSVQPLYLPVLGQSLLDALRNPDASDWISLFGEIRSCCIASVGTWIDSKHRKINEKYRKSLVDIPQKLLTRIPEIEESFSVLRHMLERVRAATPDQFFPDLARWLEDRLATTYDECLFKLYCSTSEAEAKKSCNLLLDIPDWDELGDFPVTSPNTAYLLNKLFVDSNRSINDEQTEPACRDAYGYAATRAGEKFDDLVVPGLGKVILRAMTKDASCQHRYGRIDANSFVVGAEARKQARSALEYLTQRERKGQTWQFRGGNLILFYPESELPLLNELAVADICSLPDDDEEADSPATFAVRAERIAQALDGKPRESEVPVHLIVLRKPDGHRTKLAAHHFFTMSHFVAAARAWVTGAQACPPIVFSRWGKAKGKHDDVVPVTPYPNQVARWLNTFWVRGGESQGKFKTFTLEDVLSLLLVSDGSEISLAAHALRHALANWSGFLVMNGASAHISTVLKNGDKRVPALRNLPSILSLLLSKLNYTREHIMRSPAFLVGRLMALADGLHFQYCQVVRKGSSPSQLIGNAFMQTALDSPQSALALYGQRILPYQAWARTCDAPDGKSPQALAKYFLAQLAETCAEIGEQEIPYRASDADKAQLILGYLAKPQSQN